MITKQSLSEFEEIAKAYLQELDRYDLEQLTLKPSDDEWSLGQMYVHLINSALYMQLRNVEACRDQTEPAGGAKTPDGEAIFAQGGFPPIRIQVPSSAQYTPPQPESKEQIAEGLNLVIRRMGEMEPVLDSIPAAHTVPHPRFGALNAAEWYAIIAMHYRHHLQQKNRLDAFLEQGE